MKVKMFGESSLTLLHPGSIAAFRTRFRTRFGISGSVFGGKFSFQHHQVIITWSNWLRFFQIVSKIALSHIYAVLVQYLNLR